MSWERTRGVSGSRRLRLEPRSSRPTGDRSRLPGWGSRTDPPLMFVSPGVRAQVRALRGLRASDERWRGDAALDAGGSRGDLFATGAVVIAGVRWLLEEVDLTPPTDEVEWRWFVRGMVWMFAVIAAMVIVSTALHYRVFGG